MNASDIQTVFLLERFISGPYFHELLLTWREFVAHNEACLDRYMHNLPADARNRPIPLQADVTWGGTVLPNIRDTLEALEDGYRRILSGDLNGLTAARGPVSDNRGIVDFSVDWMTQDELRGFETLLGRASLLAFNIDRTEGAYWGPGDLSYGYEDGPRGSLDLPSTLPQYQLTGEPGVRSGERVPIAGIYVPDVPHSSAQFLNTRFDAPNAEVLLSFQSVLSPLDGSVCGKEAVTEEVKCTWRRVVRSAANYSSTTAPKDGAWGRIEAGSRCPESGYYFSPALATSRRKFHLGELMPDLGSEYGLTIWQWDQNQST
jgi:hypothetical protein